MNPKQFLIIGGIVLLAVGILGFIGVVGPTAEQSIFGAPWYFDNAENWAHLVLGIVGIAAAFVLPMMAQRGLVMILGIVGVLVGLYSIVGAVPGGTNLLGAQLQNPLDTILHIVVGVWAFYASRKKAMEGMMMGGGMMGGMMKGGSGMMMK